MMDWPDFIGATVSGDATSVRIGDDTVEIEEYSPRNRTECRTFSTPDKTLFVKRTTNQEELAAWLSIKELASPPPGVLPFAVGPAGDGAWVTVAPLRPAYIQPARATQDRICRVLQMMVAVDRGGILYFDHKWSNMVEAPSGEPALIDVTDLYPPLRQRALVERARARIPDEVVAAPDPAHSPEFAAVWASTRYTCVSVTLLPSDVAEELDFRHIEFEQWTPGAVPTLTNVDSDEDTARAAAELVTLSRVCALWSLKVTMMEAVEPRSCRRGRRLRSCMPSRFPRVADWCDWVLGRMCCGHEAAAWARLADATDRVSLPPAPRD